MAGAGLKTIVIAGLGNPGERYSLTRHNIGFLIVDYFAERQGWIFKHQRHLHASLAKGNVGDVAVYLLKPETYMNLSGMAVKKFLEERGCSSHELLVVLDDADLPSGELRLKKSGGSGGHNGLRSIEEMLGTDDFPRLKIGIGRSVQKALVDYVLEPFSGSELEQMPKLLSKAYDALSCVLNEPMEKAMSVVNVRCKMPENKDLKEDCPHKRDKDLTNEP